MSDYKQDHVLAKLIIAIVVAILITGAQISSMPISLVLNIVAIFVWFFGVNPLAYLIEEIRGHSHKHDKL
jgi:ACR3 family arsenite efflux pump ArsB